jgi:hypothetical protein
LEDILPTTEYVSEHYWPVGIFLPQIQRLYLEDAGTDSQPAWEEEELV